METVEAAPLEASSVDALDLAAQCLERGDNQAAIPHLEDYLRDYPEALMLRAQLAELYWQQQQADAAETEFERFIADAQTSSSSQAQRHMIHCRTRLMELAEQRGDQAAMARQQAIGLWLLVQRWQSQPERADAIMAERTLAQALDALRIANVLDPTDTRVYLYSALVLRDLHQAEAARNAWRSADRQRPDPRLTPWEREILRNERAKLER